jgi:anti-sigma regulatory factor (Ser/Thr protein kinase)
MDAARAGFEVEVPAEAATLPELRRRLRAWLARRHCGPAESADLVLAVSEACNNAIEHGYRDRDRGGTIKLSIEVDQGTIRAVVEDQGSWHETPGKTDERGRGITLMQHLMHTTEIESDANGTRVTLVLRVRAGRESGLIAAPATPSA